ETTAIIACIAIVGQCRRVRMEGGRTEAVCGDVGQRTHCPGMAHAEQVEIVGMVPVMGQYGYGIQRRPVVVQLPLDARQFAAIYKIPITPGTPVIAPMWHSGHIGEDSM